MISAPLASRIRQALPEAPRKQARRWPPRWEMPMSTPVTKLDERYSDPAATAIGWEETRTALEGAELFWISTVRADGRPHVTPVVAAWAEGAIWFTTGADEQKFVNLRAHPHVVLTTGSH